MKIEKMILGGMYITTDPVVSKGVPDHVEIPDFPKTVSRFDRLIGFLGSPAKDPVEATIGNDLSVVFHVSLLVGVPILSLITILFMTL
ncbi:hypothetical protein bcere0004_44630 [Bacillus cereus BGSC 6E1]|nr:hypothetical protein bcere0004_44630 [Bacillus cereus BGSC 6E1]